MTPEERAEKILDNPNANLLTPAQGRHVKALIAAEIREAVRDEELRVAEYMKKHWEPIWKEEAYEEAAKIASKWPGPDGIIYIDGDVRDPVALQNGLREGIAKAIRARAEAKGKP